MSDETIKEGTPVWFPCMWELGVLDSVLIGPNNSILAYVIEKTDGTKVAIDMQVVEKA